VLAGMKAHATPALRDSVKMKIKELEADLNQPAPPPRDRRPPRREF
jgi:hypothetical protein